MADNQYSRRHASRIEDLPENDPLAELARIVGYGQESIARTPKRDIDLESELLRELGVFDSPPEKTGQVAPAPEQRRDDLGDAGETVGDAERFADGSVEISLEDELLYGIEDGYNAAPREVEASFAPDDDGGEFAASAYEENVEPASAWENDSAEEFDALARHEALDQTQDDKAHADFDPIDTYAVDEIDQVEAYDQDGTTRSDVLSEDEHRLEHGAPDQDLTPTEAAASNVNSEDEALPFIELSHPDHEADDQQDLVSIDAFALEAELAAELDADAIAREAVSARGPEADNDDFHAHHLFDPAPEAWRDENAAQEIEPTAADYEEPEEAVGFAGADPSGADAASPSPLAPPEQGHSADDILADIERFDIVPADEGIVPTDETVTWTSSEPVASREGDEPKPEAAAPDLDDWLREMAGGGFGPRAEAPAEVTEQTEPEAWEDDNVVSLWPAAVEPEMSDEIPSAELDVAGEEDFVGDDMIDLDAALEADLAAVHEEILSESEIGSTDGQAEAVSFEASGDERFVGPARHPEEGEIGTAHDQAGDETAASAVADEGEPDESREKSQGRGFFFPTFEPAASAEDRNSFSDEHEIVAVAGSSPADLEAVASREAGVADEYAFDPAALADTDEPVELIGDLDVPDVSRDADAAPAVSADDEFELDMEADFADLLDREQAEPAAVEMPAHAAGIAAAGLAASAAATAAYGREQSAAVTPADVTFDYAEMERDLDDGIADGLAEDSAPLNPFDDERPHTVGPAAAAGGSSFNRRRLVLLGGVAGFVVLAALGFIAWNSGDAGQGSDGPRIIAADSKPAKEKPADPGGKTVPNQNKVVYDSVDGTMSQTPEQKNLVTTAEKPVDVVQRTLDPDVLPLDQQPRDISPADDAAGNVAQAGNAAADQGKGQDRLAPDANQQATARQAPRGVEPHRVQTMVVTADGKLVPRDDGQQPAEETSATPPAETLKPAAPQAEPQPISAPEAASDTPAASTAAAPRPSPRPVEAASDPTPPAASTATPAPPAAQPATATQQPEAETANAKPPVEQAAPVDNPGGYFIQIASQPTEAGASASYKNLSTRYSSVIGGRGVDIQRADISGKGVYYRVRIPAGSRQEAITLCENYKSAGGACFVTR